MHTLDAKELSRLRKAVATKEDTSKVTVQVKDLKILLAEYDNMVRMHEQVRYNMEYDRLHKYRPNYDEL